MVSAFLTRRSALLSTLAGISALPLLARAETSPAASVDLVVLTIGGQIDKPNRPPFNAAHDKFFDHHNLSFDRAYALRLSELAALPQFDVNSHEDNLTYRGPSLSDALRLAGAKPEAKGVQLYALDGYAVEIPMANVAAQKWILGMLAGGKPLEIGALGPLRLMREVSSDVARQDEEHQKWVYALFYIEVMG